MGVGGEGVWERVGREYMGVSGEGVWESVGREYGVMLSIMIVESL